MKSNNELIIYITENRSTKAESSFGGNTRQLSQNRMAELFQRNKSTVYLHIKNIFEGKKLDKKVVVAKYATTAPPVQ